MKQSSSKQLMAFDFGTKHIGIAVGQSLGHTAQALCQINAQNGMPDWEALDVLIKEWEPVHFIIGLPLNMDGTESHMSHRAKKFANRLADRYHLKFDLVDERLSSHAVKQIRSESALNKRQQAQEIDSLAAQLILETWHQEHELKNE